MFLSVAQFVRQFFQLIGVAGKVGADVEDRDFGRLGEACVEFGLGAHLQVPFVTRTWRGKLEVTFSESPE